MPYPAKARLYDMTSFLTQTQANLAGDLSVECKNAVFGVYSAFFCFLES